ncbi:MAG: NAD(P)-dependent oxidoreductase [Acidobacteria bacterium]|nr:NAD(P)-dependent oxidoreductase [Acidobacteriota bacterium]
MSDEQELPKIGFIGLGIMGAPMAGRLLAAGYPLTVYNRTRAKAEPLYSRGAKIARAPRELAEHSDVVITMVSDSPDVEEVILGPEGVIHGISPDSLVVDMSTISPRMERYIESRLRGKGAFLLDAPVSGGDVGAKNATLAIMVGGDPAAFERGLPIFRVLGKSITYCGKSGSGQLTKLCNQILVVATLLGVCESIAFAKKNGLDALSIISAVKEGAAASWQLSNLGPRIIAGDNAPGFTIDLVQKDLRIVLETAREVQASLPGVALVHQLFSSAQAHGEGFMGTQALARTLARLCRLPLEP